MDGHEVRELARGDELLHALLAASDRNELPTLVISDVSMPGMSGIDALELVRARIPALPVMLMTGSIGADVVSKAGRLNVSCIFKKPFVIDAMRAAVISLLTVVRNGS